MTKTQVAKGRDKVIANAAKARQQARQAASQVAPFATSARSTARRGMDSARKGVYSARTWTAPRLERTGEALQDRVAPKVSAMLCNAARRIEPPRPKRRMWPFAAAAAALLGAAAAAAAGVIAGRRGKGPLGRLAKPEQAASSGESGQPAAEASMADVNGRVPAS